MKAKIAGFAGLLFFGGLYLILSGFVLALPLVIIGFVIWLFVSFFWSAENDVVVTEIQEGTGKAIVVGGEFVDLLISFQGSTVDKKTWFIIPEDETHKEPPRFLGGYRVIRWWPPWPFSKVYAYHHKWTNLLSAGKLERHEEWLDFFLLKINLYGIDMTREKKTSEGEPTTPEDFDGVPLKIIFGWPGRIVNPYVAGFKVRRWLPQIEGAIEPIVRMLVGSYRYKEDLTPRKVGPNHPLQGTSSPGLSDPFEQGTDIIDKVFWPLIKEELEEADRKYWESIGESRMLPPWDTKKRKDVAYAFGIEVQKRGMDFYLIDPTDEYRKLTTMQYEAEQNKKRREIAAKAEAFARGNEIAGAFISAQNILVTEKKRRQDAGEEHGDILSKEDLVALLQYWKGSEEGAIQDIRIPGGAPIDTSLFRTTKLLKQAWEPKEAPPKKEPPKKANK